MITYGEAAEAIGRYVGFLTDSQELKDLILAAEQAIWSSGKWWGLHKEYDIQVVGQTFALPSELGHIVAVNVDDSPVDLGGRYYQFHKNGPGTVHDALRCTEGNKCVNHAIDLGEFPLYRNFSFEKLIIRSHGHEDPGSYVIVNGIDHHGDQVYTYEKKVTDPATLLQTTCAATAEEAAADDQVVTLYGEKIALRPDQLTKTCNIWKKVTGITKSPTKTPVDFFIDQTDSDGNRCLHHVLTMQPHETTSAIRHYRLPGDCRCRSCVHVLAKVAEPRSIVHDSQPLLAPNMEALRLFAMSKNFELNKQDPKMSEQYRLLAIRNLDEHLSESRGHTPSTIEVTGPDVDGGVEFEWEGAYQ